MEMEIGGAGVTQRKYSLGANKTRRYGRLVRLFPNWLRLCEWIPNCGHILHVKQVRARKKKKNTNEEIKLKIKLSQKQTLSCGCD